MSAEMAAAAGEVQGKNGSKGDGEGDSRCGSDGRRANSTGAGEGDKEGGSGGDRKGSSKVDSDR
jgi:hypothetical protein